MKKILITGSNSYVGTSFTKYVNEHYPNNYEIEEISVQGNEWKSLDFSKYDVVFHVAGIAHIKETRDNESLYYKVNRDLAIEVANKAKRENISQFIFLSSMNVYGIDKDEISRETHTNPKTAYGKSKLQAEVEINKLKTNNFNIVILRPPMIYGPGCKGNYPKLARLAKVVPIFPNFPNKRSMIFIDNLTLCIKELIDHNKSGLYLPQNDEYINTSEMVKLISRVNNRNLYLTRIFNPIIKMMLKIPIVNKIFGDLVYVKNASNINYYSFEESIEKSENQEKIWKKYY